MTSEPDSKPERRPPTIELTATEVGNAAAQSGSTAPGGEAPKQHARAETNERRALGGIKSHAISAGIGAIVMAAIIGGFWIAGFRPSHQTTAPASPTTSAAGTAAPQVAPDTSSRLDKVESAGQAEQAFNSRVASVEAQEKSLSDSLAALNKHLDEIAGASQSATKQAEAAQAAADAVKNANQAAVQRGDLDALANRIAALESAVKALSNDSAYPASGANDQAARLTVAAEALRAAVERGAPYQAELAAVQSLGIAASAIAPLQPFAATGLPSAETLAQDLATLTSSLQQAADLAVNGNTFLGRLKAHAQQLVSITPIDAPAGNDPDAVIARMNAEAERGDIAAALADAAQLPDAAKPLAAGWIKKASDREAAIAASRQIAADALAALSKSAAQ